MDRLQELVHLSIGRASMCWSEIPKGVFNDVYADQIAQELIAAIEEHLTMPHKKTTIDELEKLLNSEEDAPIQVLPNGEIREVGQAAPADMGIKKPLTMKENLGGEY